MLLAPACVSCDALLDAPLDGPVCRECWQAIPVLHPPLCDGCGEPLAPWRRQDIDRGRCARCRRAPRAVSRVRAVGAYDGTLRLIIHALKYGGRRSLAGRLGALMRLHGGDVLLGADAVVPVPLHGTRLRGRGFNQAADLARPLGLPAVRALVRRRATPPQADLPSAQRHANVREAFAATRAMRRWSGATLVLVDDVCTTGATLEACARALREAGAADVRALTAARAVRRRP